jgi:18S rRNA (adenine1779-N6/adenine1780-N6)-dimethyltransferase
MLEKNYRTAAALKNEPVPDNFDIKAVVLEVLAQIDMSQKRSAKLAIDDFLKILAAFNEKGIHFC